MRKALAVFALIALPWLAACEPESDSNDAERDSNTAGGATNESSAGTDAGALDEEKLTRSSENPCEGRDFWDERPAQGCDVVAWVDLNGDDVAEPIAIVWLGGPEILLVTNVDGEEYSYGPGLRKNTREPYLGPDLSTPEASRYHTFAGAFEMTGDETPELVLWLAKEGNADTFRVLSFTGSGFEPLETPDNGKYSGGENWATLVQSTTPSYRCTEDPDAPLESINSSSAGLQSAEVTYDEASRSFSRGEFSPDTADELDRENMALGIDCADHSDRDEAPSELSGGPGTRCELGTSEKVLPSQNEFFYLEGIVSKGEIGCDDVTKIWEEFADVPKDESKYGDAQIVNFGEHTCSFPPDSGQEDAVSSPGCTSLDDSWSFTVDSR